MDNLMTIAFEAHSSRTTPPPLPGHVGRDLLDDWTVAIRYGRTARADKKKRFASPKAEEMRPSSATGSGRRLSAHEAYRLPLPPDCIELCTGF